MMLFYCAFVLSLQIPLQTYRLSQYQSSKYDDVLFIASSLSFLKKVQFHSSLSLKSDGHSKGTEQDDCKRLYEIFTVVPQSRLSSTVLFKAA